MLTAVLLLVLTLLPMLYLNRWLSRHIQGLSLLLGASADAAVKVYFIIMLPGIIIHELSHWMMARLLGLKTGRIAIGPRSVGRGKVRLGSVSISRADFVRESLVGAAPLLIGSLLILLIGTVVFDLRALSQALIIRDLGWFVGLLWQGLGTADFWVWLYLIFAISNAMLPSESDRRAWLPLGIFFAVITIPLALAGWIPSIPQPIVDNILGATIYLGTAFLVSLAIDVLFVGVISGLEKGISVLTGHQIRY